MKHHAAVTAVTASLNAAVAGTAILAVILKTKMLINARVVANVNHAAIVGRVHHAVVDVAMTIRHALTARPANVVAIVLHARIVVIVLRNIAAIVSAVIHAAIAANRTTAYSVTVVSNSIRLRRSSATSPSATFRSKWK